MASQAPRAQGRGIREKSSHTRTLASWEVPVLQKSVTPSRAGLDPSVLARARGGLWESEPLRPLGPETQDEDRAWGGEQQRGRGLLEGPVISGI